MSSRRALAWGCEFKVQTGVTVLNQAVSVCLPAFQLNSAKICSRPGSVNGFSFCASPLKKGQRLMCQCAKVFWFPAPLWRVIKRGSSVRWMCNCISGSFFLPFSPSHHLAFSIFFSVSAVLVLSWLSSQPRELAFSYRPVKGVPTFVCMWY